MGKVSEMEQTKKIILASASPRRKELLEKMGLAFEIITSQVEENIENGPYSKELVENLALEKALDVSRQVKTPALIIGADTVVVIDGIILGKPKDKNDAVRILGLLSGRTHTVVTSIAIIDTKTNTKSVESVESKVTFKKLSLKEVEDYIATGEPMDKAGAYGIQGYASSFITSICGCYTNVVGISTYKLSEMLKKFT
jgi:septum formation protein